MKAATDTDDCENTFLLHEPLPCNPAVKTAIQPLICAARIPARETRGLLSRGKFTPLPRKPARFETPELPRSYHVVQVYFRDRHLADDAVPDDVQLVEEGVPPHLIGLARRARVLETWRACAVRERERDGRDMGRRKGEETLGPKGSRSVLAKQDSVPGRCPRAGRG